jgi:predicted metal-dependent enzyme (double-stranded beta helix superfamily)
VGQYQLDEFINQVRAAVGADLQAAEVLTTLTPAFQRLLHNTNLLSDDLAAASLNAPEVCLYQDPVHEFVVLVRGLGTTGANRPAAVAATPHDHGSLWALYGTYRGQLRLQRFEVDEQQTLAPYPGLRLTRDIAAQPGDFDAIEPHHLHLPVRMSSDTITLVVYNKPLGSVVRRAYLPDLRQLVVFQGLVPPTSSSSSLLLSRK